MGPEVRARRAELGLVPLALRVVGGLVFVCLSEDPPPFDELAAAVDAHLAAYRTDRTQVVARHHYRVRANWKVLVDNNRECYHCSANHQSFCLSNFELGMAGDTRSNSRYEAAVADQRARWVERGLPTEDVSFPDGSFLRVARLPLRDGFLTETVTGGLAAPLLGDLTDAHVGSVRLITLPNSWSHVNADYVMTTRLTPVDVGSTDVDVVFLVRDDAVEGRDYDVEDVARVWVATSEEDWALCEANAAGIASRAYRPGPLSPVTENSVAAFHAWWLRCLGLGEHTWPHPAAPGGS
jgi:Rieske 2Fe-2S family protein